MICTSKQEWIEIIQYELILSLYRLFFLHMKNLFTVRSYLQLIYKFLRCSEVSTKAQNAENIWLSFVINYVTTYKTRVKWKPKLQSL